MSKKKWLRVALIILLPVLLVTTIGLKGETVQKPLGNSTSLATVSGTIRHNSNPVEGVSIHVLWEGGRSISMTAANGTYNVANVPTGGWIQIFVRPRDSHGLEYRNWSTQNFSGSLVKDFDLAQGFRLEGRFYKPDGTAFTHGTWLHVYPLGRALPSEEWSGDHVDETGQFILYVAQGIYNLDPTQRDLYPFHMPHTNVDMSADKTGLNITFLKEREPPFPTKPPVLSKITVADPDINGIAQVTGSNGAVLPLSAVALVNLSAKNFATTIADSDGSFQTSLFAPPGSSLMVKYDQKGDRVLALNDVDGSVEQVGDISYMIPLPGTTFHVGPNTSADGASQDFYSAGAFFIDDGWAGWWLDGSLRGPPATNDLHVSPGDELTVEGTLYITSDSFDCDNRPGPDPNFGIDLQYLFDVQGRTEPWHIWFNSHLFTPTGLSIEKEDSGAFAFESGWHGTATSTSCVGSHTLEAQISKSFSIPNNLPEGIFRPRISIDPGGVISDQSADVVPVWYHWDSYFAFLPPVTVGDVEPPRIPWTLFGDYPVNGHRGVQALEDVGHYSMPTRVVYPPHLVVVPMIDARTGKPLTYRLEPGSHWLSGTDRRMPNPPHIPLAFPGGTLSVEIHKPDDSIEVINPTTISQSSQRTPTLPGGSPLDHGTGHIGDLYHLRTGNDAFEYSFDQYGAHLVVINGTVKDVYGNEYVVHGSYELLVARVLDLDPAQLPTTPYEQSDYFAQGLHLFPPLPADVEIRVSHLPDSDPSQIITNTIIGKANRFGYFQPPPNLGKRIRFDSPGEFRVDVLAQFWAEDDTLWAGAMTWGNVVEGPDAAIEAHGRRGMDYRLPVLDSRHLPWFRVHDLDPDMTGVEVYYPYFSGDIHWGNEDRAPGDSIHSIITIKEKPGTTVPIYDTIRTNYSKARSVFRWPPTNITSTGLEERLRVHEAPLFITTNSGIDAAVDPDVDQWGYFYGSSERPDVHVREIISEDNMGSAYWRFDDTYGYQIGEGAAGDLPGDLKWEFGGAVFRIPDSGINEYAIYSSLWVLLPHGCDSFGCARVTSPFQDATGAGINGGPIMTLLGEEIDMLFLPKSIRPGDVLETGDTVAFSGHVGPPLDSRVAVTITSPAGVVRSRTWHANKIGWLYDPTFDFKAKEAGHWTVDVFVEHDRPYIGNGVTPQSHNTGTVLGTQGSYSFYVVEPTSRRLFIAAPKPGFIVWPEGQIEPIVIRGAAPAAATTVHYTIHDKGVVMGQGTIVPDAAGLFELVYDPVALNKDFSFLSLTAHEGLWQGLADEVAIYFLATGSGQAAASTVTLVGEEVFLGNEVKTISLPAVMKQSSE